MTQRLLLIEDDDLDREAVYRFLVNDYIVIEAINGEEALRALNKTVFDCVLLDYRLPDYDGLELLRKIVAYDTPVIILTGEQRETMAEDALTLGCLECLSKHNISQESLNRAIVGAMQRWELGLTIRRQQNELQRTQEQLANAKADLQQFTQIVSHDLHEPLQTISSFASLLSAEYRGKLDSSGEEFLEIVVQSAKRLSAMLDALKNYSQIGSDDQSHELVDLNEVLSSVQGRLAHKIEESHAQLVVDDDLPKVWGAAPELRQVMAELIQNAITFCDTEPVIHVSVKDLADVWQISVQDNGQGLAPNSHARVFDVFQQLSKPGQQEGIGMGLPICRRIMERLGGEIWIESLETGTVVHLSFVKKAAA